MKVIVIDDDGYEMKFDDVLAYAFLSPEDIQDCAAMHDTKLSDGEIKDVVERVNKMDGFPNLDDLRWIVGDIISDREFT